MQTSTYNPLVLMTYRRKLSALQTLLSQGPLQPGGFLRNVLILTTGTALSQAIMLAALPLLTRLYTPGDFGLLAQFTILSTILSTVTCLGYEPAIVLPKRNRTALSLWLLCLVIGLTVSIFCWLILDLWHDEIAILTGDPELENWLPLIPITLFIWAVTVATTQWCTRQRKFNEVSTGLVWNRLTAICSQVLLGLIPAVSGPAGLVTGFIVGSVTGLGVLLHKSRKNLRDADWHQLRLKRILMLAWYYRDFPGFGLASNLMGALGRALPIFSLGYFFSPATVGFFALANQLVAGPVQLITNSIVDVFFERANRAKLSGTLPELTANLYSVLISILLTPMALLSIAAPEITAVVFGEEWEQTGIFIRWLAIWFFFLSSITPMYRIFLVLNRQNELAAINVISLVVTGVTLFVGGTYGDPIQTIILFCVGTGLVRTGEALRVMVISGNSMRLVIELPIKEFLKSLPLLLPLLITRVITDDQIVISLLALLLLGIFGVTRFKSLIRPAPAP